MSSTYTVTIEVSVTADSPLEAAQYALSDLRDGNLGPWNFDVLDDNTGKTTQEAVEGEDASDDDDDFLHNCDATGYTIENLKPGDSCEHCGEIV